MGVVGEEQGDEGLGTNKISKLSAADLPEFVARLASMDRAEALKLIAQIVDFKALVSDGLSQLEKQVSKAHKFNWKSQKKVHKAFKAYREALDRELERDSLTSEDRFRILEMYATAVDKEVTKDSENKAHIAAVLTIVGGVAVAVAMAVVNSTGGKGGSSVAK
jgi:hypothetical protein